MKVLGIETSCDETGIAVYDDQSGLLANQLYSQINLHADYGGVVPELASRDHIRKTVPLIQAALKQANITAEDIDGVAYTAGPGLIGALISAVRLLTLGMCQQLLSITWKDIYLPRCWKITHQNFPLLRYWFRGDILN